MRSVILMIFVGLLMASAVAGPPPWAEKPLPAATTPIAVDRDLVGDTVADALPIESLPFADTGSTCGYADDYDARCWQPSTAPDLVYGFTPATDTFLDIDLCGSAYDTKVIVLDADLGEYGCSDDYYYYADDPCGEDNAFLDALPVNGGEIYYIIIDGWGGQCGEYELSITETLPIEVVCPVGASLEGEPPLVDGYFDLYNGECDSDPEDPLAHVLPVVANANGEAVVCGTSGYWRNHAWFPIHWDTDFYAAWGAVGMDMEVEIEVEHAVYLAERIIPDGDCAAASFAGAAWVPAESSGSLLCSGLGPDQARYFVVWPLNQTYPYHEYDYVLRFTGLLPEPVVVEAATLSDIKGLFR